MSKPLFPAIPIEYAGLYADDHLIDAQELGTSLQGFAKVSNAVVHFYLHGQIASGPRLYQVRLFATPPKRGSLSYEIVALLVNSSLPIYAHVLCNLADEFVPKIFEAIVDRATGKHKAMEAAINKMAELAAQHQEFAKDVHQGHMQDKAWLQDHIDKLTARNAAPLREVVKPIGSSCRQIKVGSKDRTEPALIDEPDAQVLSSKEDMEVGDMRTFRGTFEGVDTTNGLCKVRLVDDDTVVPGKITDPALERVGNVYTHSLDTGEEITVTAKPVIKDGHIVKLYISAGRAKPVQLS